MLENPVAQAIGVGAVLAPDGTPYWITELGTTRDRTNDPTPLAHRDLARTSSGRPVTINVVANDSDHEKQWLGIVDASSPQHGSIGIPIGTPNNIRYTPDPGFTGTDHFRYKVANLVGLTATATVTVTVRP